MRIHKRELEATKEAQLVGPSFREDQKFDVVDFRRGGNPRRKQVKFRQTLFEFAEHLQTAEKDFRKADVTTEEVAKLRTRKKSSNLRAGRDKVVDYSRNGSHEELKDISQEWL